MEGRTLQVPDVTYVSCQTKWSHKSGLSDALTTSGKPTPPKDFECELLLDNFVDERC